MRIDREAFLLAAWTLAGCERAELMDEIAAPPPAVVRPSPAPAVAVRAPVEQVLPPPAPPTPAVPKPTVRPQSAAKRWFLGLSTQQQTSVTAVCKRSASDPCAVALTASGELAELGPRPPANDPVNTFLTGLTVPQRQQVAKYCTEGNPRRGMPAPTCETPLVVAFDDRPIELRASAGEFAFVPGAPMASRWPTAATPWIARDLDGDGAITTGAELFGSSTAIAGGTARHGFEALAALDANADGTIDASDPAFATLLLWSDRDGDHRSTPDELRPLRDIVTSIPLAHTLDVRCTGGDCEGERGLFRWRDAANTERTGTVVDLYLRRR